MTTVPAEVRAYLDAVEGERGEALRAVFDTVLAAMPSGYHLGSFRDAPAWVIPLSVYPVTYNKQPLNYVTLMAQKNYNSLYLMGLYGVVDETEDFKRRWQEAGLKLDMGKACLRFKTRSDVDLPIIAHTVAGMTPERLIAIYESHKLT